ncbi:helix-turn-helix domain-containing protein [Algoriphagus marinus]|uniref:helix-turn-helix domain-containing protein n=1 Tax=Algoriphagus marinus TaxID=1925762 RepID=UPI00094B822A|nr:helix-turn-helix transcriptional regulator [Algoriphagus marinus]
MDIKEEFGKRLAQMRKERKISQEQLAELSGLNRPYISGIEQGKRNVSLEVIVSLAKALGIKTKELFEE